MTTLDNTEVRQGYPFIRPKLKLSYAIPFYGLNLYLKTSNKIKKEAEELFLDAEIQDKSGNKILSLLSGGVSTWPVYRNKQEETEAGKTIIQDSAVCLYNWAWFTAIMIAPEIISKIR